MKQSQPQGIISGLKTNSSTSLSCSAHKSFKTNRNISTAQLKYFTTHRHTHTKYFYGTKIFLYRTSTSSHKIYKFTSAYLKLYRTYQSLSGSQHFSPNSDFGTGIQRFLLRIFLSNRHSISTLYQDMSDCDDSITCNTNWRLFFFQKKGMRQIRMTNM